MKIFDSLSSKYKYIGYRKKVVNVYICGPTVYDYIHLGNSRMLIVFDILHRTLKYKFEKVNFVQNITDVDDKIIAKSANSSPKEISEKYTYAFLEDAKTLNLLNCIRPKATDYISKMINFIEEIIKYTYTKEDGIYLNTSLIPYNRFEKKDLYNSEGNLTNKDFALWKFKDDYFWPSPWGNGRPGWHLECSVMSQELLGKKQFDIHGGGIDLKFPHHENEIAQCWARSKIIPARIWMHNEMLLIQGDKMSKSIGNMKYLRDIVKNSMEADCLRYFFCSFHYRKPINFHEWDKYKNAFTTIRKHYWRNYIHNTKSNVINPIFNDLDTPLLIQLLHKSINSQKWNDFSSIIDLLGFKMENFCTLKTNEIEHYFTQRQYAREKSNWLESDRIRKVLNDNWVEVIDGENKWYFI